MSTIWVFAHIKKQTYFTSWRRLYEKKKFCESLREHVKNIIDIENQKKCYRQKKKN